MILIYILNYATVNLEIPYTIMSKIAIYQTFQYLGNKIQEKNILPLL